MVQHFERLEGTMEREQVFEKLAHEIAYVDFRSENPISGLDVRKDAFTRGLMEGRRLAAENLSEFLEFDVDAVYERSRVYMEEMADRRNGR